MIRSNLHPSAAASWLVRFAFESPADLFRHLRAPHGFFVPARAVPSDVGARVIVEIETPGVPHATLLHGEVREVCDAGVWLDAPWARAAARWHPESRRREHRRFGSDLFVEVSHPGGQPWMSRAVDLSPGGLRITSSSLELGIVGDEIALTLLSHDRELAQLHARIAWASGRSAGLELIGDSHGLSPVLDGLEARWASVLPIAHEASCLCNGPLLRTG